MFIGNQPQIGLGLAALGRPGYINLGHGDDLNHDYSIATMEANAHAVLDEAWALGVRYFDAARSYGRAEQFLASWLEKRAIGSDQVCVGSKWGYTYTADWQISADKHEVKEHSLPVYLRQRGETHLILGNYLNIYHIHSATLDSGLFDNDAVLDGLAALRNSGVAVGFSTSGVGQADTIRRALEIERDGKLVFSVVQSTWNVLEQSADNALQEAYTAGLKVIVKEGVANGRLTPRNSNLPKFAQLAQDNNTTMDGLALSAVLARPWASVVLSGAATVEHLRANVAAEKVVWTDVLEAEIMGMQEEARVYWGIRSGLAWN